MSILHSNESIPGDFLIATAAEESLTIEQKCDNLYFATSHTVMILTFICAVLFAISTIALLSIASSIFFNSKLRTHPQLLIAWICIAEACMSFNALIEVLNPAYIICYFQSYKTLAFTFHLSHEHYLKLAELQCESNQIFYCFFMLLSLMLNTCLCIDLILTIYDPFSPAGRRMNKYYICSILIAFVSTTFCYVWIYRRGPI